jgi:Tol biopolymer transport system component
MWRPVWSPDGQRIAYIEEHGGIGSDPNGNAASLMTINANGSGLNEVLNDSHVGQALSWAPDGRILLAYREDRFSAGENYGVYSIRLDSRTGKAIGPPQPVTQAEGSIAGLNTTADGKRLILWRTNAPLQVFIAKFHARTHQFEQPRRLTLDEDFNYASAWTADSKAVLFTSNRQGMLRLFKQQIDQTTPETLVEAQSLVLPRLSPDGSEVLYLTTSSPGVTSGPVSLMAKPLAGGPPHLVIAEEGIVNFGCARAPFARCVFSKLSGQDLNFVSFEMKNGPGPGFATMRNNKTKNWVVSPDGSKLAIVLDLHRIRFLPVDKGLANDVTVKDWPLEGVDWSADGRTVFMPSVTPDGVPVVLEVDQAGKARVVLRGTANSPFLAMIQSPDGQFGLLLERTPAENNVWMVDNF